MALSELAARVADASGGRLELRVHSSLIDIAVEGSLKMPQYGARGVQRAVQRKIAVPLSKYARMLQSRTVLLPLGNALHARVARVDVNTELHAWILCRLMLRHRLDAIGLESDPNSSALRDAAEDATNSHVLELMLTPSGDEVMGRLLPEDRALVLNDSRL